MDVVVYCAGILRRSDFLLVPDWHQCQCTDFLSRVPAHRQRGTAPAAVLSTHIGDRDAKCVLSLSRWMDNHYSSAPDHTTPRRAEHRVAAAIAAEDDMETMMRFALLATIAVVTRFHDIGWSGWAVLPIFVPLPAGMAGPRRRDKISFG